MQRRFLVRRLPLQKDGNALCSYLLLLREMPMRLAALAFSAVGDGSVDVIVWFTLGAWPAPP